jgi:lipopolysaccharide transport system ATP-binding protein
MGLSMAEIDKMVPGIIDFAEIGEFFEQPLRVYSSGMQARLAFAVATAVRPDILIVDEVLSVGDSYFQHKSFARIRQFRDEGVAILFVTHGMSDVRTLCDRVILLEKGLVLKDAQPDEVVDYYNALIAQKENSKLSIEQRREKNGWLHTRSGSFEVAAEQVELLDAETMQNIATALVKQRLILRTVVKAKIQLDQLVLGLMIRDRTGHIVWGTNTWHTKQMLNNVAEGERILFEWCFECALGPGSYGISYALTDRDTHTDMNFEWVDNIIVFDVINLGGPTFVGSSCLDLDIKFERLGSHG